MENYPTWIGRTLSGRYKIEALLGQGGMSAVYKSTDPNLKRVVAIKLIHPHLSTDASFVSRFESEAAAVASLRHQNIVQVYDFNTDNGVYYMVLEFIPGETLQDRMKRLSDDRRTLSLEEIIKFTINISDAVGYAHQRGMVHRDIKPANIMLDMQGQAILMDFGIVKILGGDSQTSTGAVVGTARYMSPEIIRGEVADHRADIYSLGVTVFEMLSGRTPFVADSAMTLMMMHLNDPVPDVRSFRSDVAPEIVAILEKCLAKDRDDRYQSAAELSADLRSALTTISGQSTSSTQYKKTTATPVSASKSKSVPAPVSINESDSIHHTPIHSPSSAPKQTSRRNLWIVTGVGLLLLLCAVASFLVIRSNRLQAIRATKAASTNAPTVTVQAVSTDKPILVLSTETIVPVEIPANTLVSTETAIPFTPTPTTPYVLITAIHLDGKTYVVDYEVHNFPDAQRLHVHMFFNTVLPKDAGLPGKGPWKLTWGQYGNPPFTQYGVANRPPNATQMCALVAHPNHSVIPDSGNCVDLPNN